MIKKDDGYVKITIPSELTIYRVEELKSSILENLDSSEGILLDVTNISKIDSAGFQMIVAIKKFSMENDKEFEISEPSSNFENIIRLYGCYEYFYKG
jgi:anti-anti-sigma factor